MLKLEVANKVRTVLDIVFSLFILLVIDYCLVVSLIEIYKMDNPHVYPYVVLLAVIVMIVTQIRTMLGKLEKLKTV